MKKLIGLILSLGTAVFVTWYKLVHYSNSTWSLADIIIEALLYTILPLGIYLLLKPIKKCITK